MKKVLFIAYYFPPMGGSGVQRSLKFVKYMTRFGYLPVILTVDHRYTRWIKDKTLLAEIPGDVPVYRTPTVDLNWIYKALWGLRLHKLVHWIQLNWIVPDSEITWVYFARKSIRTILRKHKIELAYITAPPFSTMLLGPYLVRKHNVKYLVDFRDEWSNNPYRNDSGMSHRAKQKELSMENEVLENCSGIIYTHPRFMKENFEDTYPFLKGKINRIISNGFDESDFTQINDQPASRNSRMTIVYIGSFYGRRQPKCIWDALSKLIKNKLIEPEKIEFRIIGKNTKSFVLGEYAQDKDISSIVNFMNNMPYSEALSELFKSDMLLIYIAPGVNSRAEIPGKLFEYIRTNKPVLAVIPPDGSAAEILINSKTGIICNSSNATDVEKCILESYQKWLGNSLSVEPDKSYIARYIRENLTKELVSVFDEVIAGVFRHDASNNSNKLDVD